jgi:hypothetical protein
MREFKALLVAGISSAAVIGFAGLAKAESVAVHTMTVQLPGGGVETIRYAGDVAPKIVVAPAGPVTPAVAYVPGFENFRLIEAQMDRQMDMMMRQARAMQMMPMMGMPNMNQLMEAAARNGGGFCAQSMSITATGNGQPAKVVTHSVGNCGGEAATSGGGNQANDVQATPASARPIPIKTTAAPPRSARQHI